MAVSQKTKVARLEAQQAAAQEALGALACTLSDDELEALTAFWWLENDAFLRDESLREGGILEYERSVAGFQEMCGDPERHFALYASANLALWERLTPRQRVLLGWPKKKARLERELQEIGEAWSAWHHDALAQRVEALERERAAVAEAWSVGQVVENG